MRAADHQARLLEHLAHRRKREGARLAPAAVFQAKQRLGFAVELACGAGGAVGGVRRGPPGDGDLRSKSSQGPQQVLDQPVRAAALQARDVGALDAGALRQLSLGEATGPPDLGQDLGRAVDVVEHVRAEDRVEEAPGLQRNSRLSCQCIVQGKGPITIRVPAWNRNAVKEIPH